MRSVIRRIRKGKTEQKKKDTEWILNQKTSYKLDPSYYMLGKEGMKHCIVQTGRHYLKTTLLISMNKQSKHSLGLNEILVRLVQAGMDRGQIKWLATLEATEFLHRLKRAQDSDIARREIIRPDARLVLGTHKYWIEFDNGTEGANVLEKKFVNYVETLESLNKVWIDHHGNKRKPLDRSNVLWVTNDAGRKDYLQRIWKQVKYHYYKDQWVPQMDFFKAGEEIDLLMQRA